VLPALGPGHWELYLPTTRERPLSPFAARVSVWVATVAIRMLCRSLSGQGTAVALFIVATVTLAIFLIGWRAIAPLIRAILRRG